MKSRLHVVVATFTMVMGLSLAAWPQQKQIGKPQMPLQQLAADHTEKNAVTAQAFTPAASSTNYKTEARASAGDSIDVVGHLALPGAVISRTHLINTSSAG
jgi:hypothetical protein